MTGQQKTDSLRATVVSIVNIKADLPMTTSQLLLVVVEIQLNRFYWRSFLDFTPIIELFYCSFSAGVQG